MKRRLAAWAKAQKTKQRTAALAPGAIGVPCVDWMWTDAVQALMAMECPPCTSVCLDNGNSAVTGTGFSKPTHGL